MPEEHAYVRSAPETAGAERHCQHELGLADQYEIRCYVDGIYALTALSAPRCTNNLIRPMQ